MALNAPRKAMLSGVTILDLSLFVAGPFGSMILADLGAEVIKIEPLEGDPVRNNHMGARIDGESAQFQSYNRNKKSICINLKSPEGREVFLALVRTADVVFDNFRPGVLDRLGLTRAALAEVNPRIITVSLSAFGPDGPLARSPGYDLIVQALGGGMSLTGDARSGPAHIPFHLGDTAGGLYSAIAILGAIVERNRTQRGRALEVSLLDAQIALLGDEVTNFAASGEVPRPHGSGHPQLVPYRAFEAADGPLVIAAVGVEKFWTSLTAALMRPELATDPRFCDNARRVANREALEGTLQEILRERPRAHWLALLAQADVPAAPVLDVAGALAHPQVRHRQAVAEARLPNGTPVHLARTPIRAVNEAPHPVIVAPKLGAHTASLLSERAGLDARGVERLIQAGVVG